MTVAVLILMCLILVAAAVLVWRLSRASVLSGFVREPLLVTLKTGEAFHGVLFRQDARAWELVQVKALGAGQNGADVPVNGSLVLLAENVAYAQRP